MDFTTAGARSGAGAFGVRHQDNPAGSYPVSGLVGNKQRLMSSFAGDPRDGAPRQDGPVLVMPPPQPPKRPSLWLRRLWLAVFVLFCLEVGIILIVLPWTRVWTENSLLLGHPRLAGFLQQNFVRGLISGLGLVDVWMGIAEAVRYREGPDA
jgi:hypothetical protein